MIDHARIGRRSKRKGSGFERKVCAELSLWLTSGETKDLFWRSAMSGGRTTRRTVGRLLRHVSGDICTIKEPGSLLTNVFHIECKFYNDLQLGSFLLGRPSRIGAFWIETCEKAKRVYKRPMLIARQNGLPTILLLRPDIWAKFDMPKASWAFSNGRVVVGLFEEFLSHASAASLSDSVRPTLDRQPTGLVPLGDLSPADRPVQRAPHRQPVRARGLMRSKGQSLGGSS